MHYLRLLVFVVLMGGMGIASYSYVDTGFGLLTYVLGSVTLALMTAFAGVVLIAKVFKQAYYLTLLSKLGNAYSAFKRD